MKNSVEKRNQIIEDNYGLVYYAANMFKSRFPQFDYDDCHGTADVAIMKAAETYDDTFGTSFSTYFMRVANNEFLNCAKRNNGAFSINAYLYGVPSDVENYAGIINGIEDDVDFEDFVERYTSALKNSRDGHIIKDYIYSGMSYNDIAKKHGVSNTTARNKIVKFASDLRRYV